MRVWARAAGQLFIPAGVKGVYRIELDAEHLSTIYLLLPSYAGIVA